MLNKVTLVRNEHNRGYGFSSNFGATIAKGEYICFLNDDMKVKPDMLEVLVRQMCQHRDVGILVCKEVGYNCETYVNSTGMFMDYFMNTFPRRNPESGPIFYAPGAPCFTKLNLFRKIGGFDEDYYLFVEDVDLSWRIRLRGYKIIYVNDAIVYHLGSGTIGGFSPRVFYLYQRNSLMTLIKNCGKTVIPFLTLFVAQSALLIVYFSVKRRCSFLTAIIKAYISNLKNLKTTMSKRFQIQATRRVRDSQLSEYIWSGWLLLSKKARLHDYLRDF
jgi:GT2 family glycosyltransferase